MDDNRQNFLSSTATMLFVVKILILISHYFSSEATSLSDAIVYSYLSFGGTYAYNHGLAIKGPWTVHLILSSNRGVD